MNISYIYITVTYSCGCIYARAVPPPRLEREVYDNHPCEVCQQKEEAYRERAIAMRQATIKYLVDGRPMTIYQENGFWRGRYYEDGKAIRKSFGRYDPRPTLEVVGI